MSNEQHHQDRLSVSRPFAGEMESGAFPPVRLEKMIGKPREEWRRDDLVRLVKERGIRLISLMHTGGDGRLKTLDFAPGSVSHLEDVFDGGERADGSSIFADMGIQAGASDIVLRPRVRTAFLDPFSPLPTLTLFCGHAGRDGRPLPESPDTIVRAASDRLREELDLDLLALGEVEYFLGRRPTGNETAGGADLGYHASAPFVFGEDLRRLALGLLAEIGVPIKYGHSEVGYIPAREEDDLIWEQHEIELGLAPLPDAAEGAVLAQWVVRNLAHRNGMQCSFDPIVRKGHAGSGFHFHCSPFAEGKHLGGRDDDGELHPQAKWLIAGLVEMGGALMAFGNRNLGSFVRITQGKEAPNSIFWGEFNRKALVRLPIVATTAENRRIAPPTIEFRLPDGSAHPYLLLAGIAQAMRHGAREKDVDALLERTSASRAGENGGGLTHVPRNFAEMAAALEQHRAVFEESAVFPSHVIERILNNLKS